LIVRDLLNYIIVENAHKAGNRTFVFYYVVVKSTTAGSTEQTRACLSHYDQSTLTANDAARMMHILQAQVCGCISAHPGLSHQKLKQRTSDASIGQVNQAS